MSPYLGTAADKAGAGALLAGSYAVIAGSWVAAGVCLVAALSWFLASWRLEREDTKALTERLAKLDAEVLEQRVKLKQIQNKMALER